MKNYDLNAPMSNEALDEVMGDIWESINAEIKRQIIRNGYIDEIKKPIEGELTELAVKTRCGWETLFCGNKEAHISVYVEELDMDLDFSYVIDNIDGRDMLVDY